MRFLEQVGMKLRPDAASRSSGTRGPLRSGAEGRHDTIVSLAGSRPFSAAQLDARDLAERLTMLGAPVDAVEPLHADLGEIVVGAGGGGARRIPTPTACGSAGSTTARRQRLNVVCGAPNVTAGKRYPFAPGRRHVPHGKGGAPMKIERAKIRGEVSEGMLCSARELGLGQDHDGILELDTDARARHAAARGAAARRPPARHRRQPQPPRSPRPQGRRARARGRRTRRRSGCRPFPAPSTLDVPPARRAGDDRHGGRRRDRDRGRRVGCPRFHAALIRGVQVGPVAGLARAPARGRRRRARSTTWWTRPTTSCSSSTSRCTRTTLATLRGAA